MNSVIEQIRSQSTGAIFSPDEACRYVLWRHVDAWRKASCAQIDLLSPQLDLAGICVFTMLNPSTADAMKLDPTVTRVMKFCSRWGFSIAVVLNIFAYRSTDPQALRRVQDIIGEKNDDYIRAVAAIADRKVVAWGNGVLGIDMESRQADVLRILGSDLLCLGQNQDGSPKHPLARGRARVPDDFEPIPFIQPGAP